MEAFVTDSISATYKRLTGASELSTDLLSTIAYKQSFWTSNSQTSYFATFASNFSRTFSIFGLAWKVQ